MTETYYLIIILVTLVYIGHLKYKLHKASIILDALVELLELSAQVLESKSKEEKDKTC